MRLKAYFSKVKSNILRIKNNVQSFYTNHKRKLLTGATSIVLAVGFVVFNSSVKQKPSHSFDELGNVPITIPQIKYGFAIDTFQVINSKIEPGKFLGDILLAQHVDYPSIEKIVVNAKEVFNINGFRPDKPYTILTKDSTQTADYFIYEPNAFEYVIFHLKGDLAVKRIKRKIDIEEKIAKGKISSSLWVAMTKQGLSIELASKMEDVLQWSIDFHHLQKDDEFRLVYDEQTIDGKVVGIGDIKAAYYKTGNNEYFANYFEHGEESGYYDLEGRPMKKSFLKAPVKFSRISSYYNPNRLHPILKYRRPHLGTDYAAPYGTPIIAVGDGVVSAASFTKGNGNFVKIRHDDTYETQYLHMQKFAAGIHKGAHVQQGQVIGYVGSTGLATGPHVCFRFWKNGKQVNHLKLKFPPAKALPKEQLPEYFKVRNEYLKKLGFNNPSIAEATETKINSTGSKSEDKKAGNP